MLSRSESHYFWIWWLSTLKKKDQLFLFSWLLKPNGNTHVTFVGFYFKAAAKFTLEIFNITSTHFSHAPPSPPLPPPKFVLLTFFTQCCIFGRIFNI